MSVTVTPLAHDAVETLCSLAATVWRQHYSPIIGAAQTEYMLAQRYRPDLIREELGRSDVWWDVVYERDTMVAFASCLLARDAAEVKLDKLYVQTSRQRRGYGGLLIAHACERAARAGYCKMILAVNKLNRIAIAAYRRHGFEIREAVVKDIGGGFAMDDYIMEKSIAAPNGQRADIAAARSQTVAPRSP